MRQDQEFFVDGSLVEVLTTQPIDRLFTYRAPREGCFKGAVVLVPFELLVAHIFSSIFCIPRGENLIAMHL